MGQSIPATSGARCYQCAPTGWNVITGTQIFLIVIGAANIGVQGGE
jgi:hypothetical protein